MVRDRSNGVYPEHSVRSAENWGQDHLLSASQGQKRKEQ